MAIAFVLASFGFIASPAHAADDYVVEASGSVALKYVSGSSSDCTSTAWIGQTISGTSIQGYQSISCTTKQRILQADFRLAKAGHSVDWHFRKRSVCNDCAYVLSTGSTPAVPGRQYCTQGWAYAMGAGTDATGTRAVCVTAR